MRGVLRRLSKLEAAPTRLLHGPWHWPARAAEVKKHTMEAMSPEEQVLLRESFGGHGRVGRDEFIAKYPAVWTRYNQAFDRAVREVPAPYVMCTSDLWGSW